MSRGRGIGGAGVFCGCFDVAGGDVVDRGLDNGIGPFQGLADLHRARVGDQRHESGVSGGDRVLQLWLSDLW